MSRMEKVVVLSVQDASIVIAGSLALVGIAAGTAALIVAFAVASLVG